MASSPPMYINNHSQILPSEEDNPCSTLLSHPTMASRTSSFSFSSDSSIGSSSLISYIEDLPPFSPSTPLNIKGVPFSWEKIPGIPKQKDSKDKEHSSHLLPLPPAGNSNPSSKRWLNQDEKHHSNRFQEDPFFAALVECSKDERRDRGYDNMWKGSSKVTRSLSDRFGFINLYNSCKTSCAVSESLVYPPRPSTMLNRRSS